MTRRALSALAVAGVLLAAVPSPAHAAWYDSLPRPADSKIAESIVNLKPESVNLDTEVVNLKLEVENFETQRTDAGTQVIDLSTDVLFEFGSATVNPNLGGRLTELLKPIPNGAKVQVYGHTDAIGSDASNLTLSQQRAQAVADLIKAARGDLTLDVQGFGETKPLASETKDGKDDPDARASNRRVEVRWNG